MGRQSAAEDVGCHLKSQWWQFTNNWGWCVCGILVHLGGAASPLGAVLSEGILLSSARKGLRALPGRAKRLNDGCSSPEELPAEARYSDEEKTGTTVMMVGAMRAEHRWRSTSPANDSPYWTSISRRGRRLPPKIPMGAFCEKLEAVAKMQTLNFELSILTATLLSFSNCIVSTTKGFDDERR